MTTSALQLADYGLDNLYSVQEGLSGLLSLFTVMMNSHSEDSTAYAFAVLGTAETEEWLNRTAVWADHMQTELDRLDSNGELK